MRIQFHRDARRSKEEVGGMKVPYAPAKRATPKLRWYLILTGVSAPLIILVAGLIGRSISITADGSIAQQHQRCTHRDELALSRKQVDHAASMRGT